MRKAGGTPMEFNTIAISDGITMGTEGMKTSLVSREVIADSIELCTRGYMFDALVCLVGCDKTIPAAAMALARLNIPGIILYGGSILPGTLQGPRRHHPGRLRGGRRERRRHDHRRGAGRARACRLPGPGACGGQFTANTMALAMEFIGLSPMGSASVPAVDPRKDDVGVRAGEIVMDVLRRNQRPLDILTRKAFENAIAGVAATGGSTNAVLHLLALAREAERAADHRRLRHRQRAHAAASPTSSPGGRYLAADLDTAGGVQLVAQRLVDGGFVDGDAGDAQRPHDRRGGRAGRRDAGPGRRRRRSTSR